MLCQTHFKICEKPSVGIALSPSCAVSRPLGRTERERRRKSEGSEAIPESLLHHGYGNAPCWLKSFIHALF